MEPELIITIVTAGIALITSAVSFAYTFIQNKKERIRKIVLDNRIRYMNEIRQGFTDIIGLSYPAAIKLAKNNNETMKSYAEKLFNGFGKIKTYLKPFYKIDKEVLHALDCLYTNILSALHDNDETTQDIDKLRNDFADKYLKYDWAYWKYIQQQKDGKYKNSDDDFDKVYYDFIKSIEKK